jgi:hypothetical protein
MFSSLRYHLFNIDECIGRLETSHSYTPSFSAQPSSGLRKATSLDSGRDKSLLTSFPPFAVLSNKLGGSASGSDNSEIKDEIDIAAASALLAFSSSTVTPSVKIEINEDSK